MWLAQFKWQLKQAFHEFLQDINYYAYDHEVDRPAFMPGLFHGLKAMWLYRKPFFAHMLGLIIGALLCRLFGLLG